MDKRYLLLGAFAALCLGIVAIGATWSATRAVQPPVASDTTSTPNPAPQRK